MGGAIFVFFLFMILWQFIVYSLILITNSFNIGDTRFPEWYFALNFLNPLEAYGAILSLNIPSIAAQQTELIAVKYPSFFNTTNMLITLILWLFIPLILAYWRFKNKDI